MNQVKKKNLGKRVARIAAKTILYTVLFVLIVLLLVQTPPVQNFLRKKIVAYLETTLETKVQVGRIKVVWPKDIVLQDVYVEDRNKDTLLSGGLIKADLDIWDLAVNNEIDIRSISLENVTARINRDIRDTTFNFQFIVDAFTPKRDSSSPADSASTAFAIGSLELDKVRVIYNDVVTGSNMDAWIGHLDTKIDRFDGINLHFDVPEATIRDLRARITQVKPLAMPEPEVLDSVEAAEPVTMQLNFGEFLLENIDIEYRNDVSAMYTSFDIGELKVKPNRLDLVNRLIDLDVVSLHNSNSSIKLGRKELAKVVVKEIEQEAQAQVEAGWKIRIDEIDLVNNQLQFDNDNNPRISTGMDYGHLKADSFTLKATDFVLTADSVGGNISEASFKEQSGFVLNELKAEFLYTDTESWLRNFYLLTPGSELKRDALIRYASPESMTTDIANMQVDLDIQQSKLLVRDLLTFVPAMQQQPAFAYPGTTWYINARITGRVGDLDISTLQLSGLNDTRVDVSGRLAGLPTLTNMEADLDIRNLTTSRRDLNLFIPKGTIPTNITLPSRMSANGSMRGNAGRVRTNLNIATDMGNASVNGIFSDPGDPVRATYDATIVTRSLDIARIIQQPQSFGPVSATFTAKGRGFDPKTANAVLNGTIHSVRVNNYNYQQLKFDASIADQLANFTASIADPNIDFNLEGTANLGHQYPAVRVSGMIDSIKLAPLNLAKERLIYRGKVDANFPVSNPDALEGELLLTQSLFVQDNNRLNLDTVRLTAGVSDSGRFINLVSDVMVASLEGRYQLTQLGTILQQAVQPYFAVAPTGTVAVAPYDFTLNAYVIDNPALKVFVPDLKKMDSVSIQSHFSNDDGWWAIVNAPALDIGPNSLRNLNLRAGTGVNAIDLTATVQRFNSGSAIQLDNTTLTATLANNNIDFTFNSKDRGLKDKYNIKGLLTQPRNGNYHLSIKQDSLVLNYDAWNVSADNSILITNAGINAKNLVLSNSGQQLTLNSLSSLATAPLEVNFSNFQLGTLTGFIQTDSTLANGTMNGKVTFTNIMKEPVFVGDLTVSDFSFKGDTIGNIQAKVNNTVADTYGADITLNGRGNDARLTGNYFVRPSGNSFDFDLDLRSLPMTTIQAFSNEMITGSKGFVNGKFDVTGTISRPLVKGDLNFNQAGFNFKMLNSYFTIDQEKISINEQGLSFNRFQIKDSAQNSLVINGTAATSNFANYRFDLDVRANNFRALNSTKLDNPLFYGQLYFNTNLKVKGTEAAPAIDGSLVINDKTKMTVVLPQRDQGVVSRDGIVEFVDMDAPLNDSLFLAGYDSLNQSGFSGLDIAVNVEVVREAEFSLVIDEGNGDFLNVKGEALLTGGIDPSGKINLVGSYELYEGSYELTFNFLKRRFMIQPGSRIVWEGEPTAATLDVEAVYVANAAPLDLVKNQLGDASAFERNTYLQKLPFDVHLDLEGPLLQPQITFDIILPEKSYVVGGDIITNVRTRLDQLRQEPGEMNKQVFSLLLLNRFMTENPFNAAGDGLNAGVLARQSVSKLLTEQLNRLAGDLVAGVGLNFDVVSSEDYTTGERRDRTDLNVGLSKQLLNDRLTVSIGSNFELEGPAGSTNQQSSNIAGNVALDYRISKDNRYLLRAYRKNEYQGVIDGYIIETGVAFIITVDYNRFRQIFMSRSDRQQRREQRKKLRELNAQPPTTQPTDSIPPNN